jgi:hypothetical protein
MLLYAEEIAEYEASGKEAEAVAPETVDGATESITCRLRHVMLSKSKVCHTREISLSFEPYFEVLPKVRFSALSGEQQMADKRKVE